MYAVGKIPGGFIKREGKPSERAVLTSRVIDRPIRPLFPKDLRNDVTVVNTVLSVALVIHIVLTTALAIYVFTFVPPIGRAPIEPTPTMSNEGRRLEPGIWATPELIDTPGPRPMPVDTPPLPGRGR